MSFRVQNYRAMLLLSALSWALVTLMPVINAHGSSTGVWATLCTLNGFELVQIEEGEVNSSSHAKACPFGHFSSFHQDKLPTVHTSTNAVYAHARQYVYLALNIRFEQHIPRAPPQLTIS
ncbi:hypothetical protein AB2S62_20675 [Vibrio sp. NTOU-M3]|uniref:hypothetical protein n=1 Tax=Vibrio sp. NTOU-M3 TaxID=3234954 RepID=UPI00349F9091